MISEKTFSAKLSDGENIYEITGVKLISFNSKTFDTTNYVMDLPENVEKSRKSINMH